MRKRREKKWNMMKWNKKEDQRKSIRKNKKKLKNKDC
jgi:hypothetical protein